jgi:DNA-binding transcriptional ArsR family regulator
MKFLNTASSKWHPRALQGGQMNEDRCVDLLKMLADQTRWRLVNALLEAPANVSELTDRLAVSQYNVSKHLRVLREGGLVNAVRHGKEVVCSIAADFRAKIRDGGWALDLGCCTFRFDCPPKCCEV